MRRALIPAWRWLRIAGKAARAFASADHPVLVHLVPMRRCNLDCGYCNEYDTVSSPVPLEILKRRVAKLRELGTACVTISGGEPLLHPELYELIAELRRARMVATLISNGYLLSREVIGRLNRAGLDHIEISIDNVEPDEVSKKSLRLLEPKLRWLAELAEFGVAVNSVIGSGIRNPEDALAVAQRARELGFMSSVGIIHDGHGQLKPLGPRELAVYRQLKAHEWRLLNRFNGRFQENLVAGLPNDWRCRAGSRYLYVDEHGIVHYCSQQRGAPGVPLMEYGAEDLRREFSTQKACAPFCTVNCVQQVAFFDVRRGPQPATARLAPVAEPAKPAGDAALVG